MATARQRRKVKRVMREFKRGELKAGRGRRGNVRGRRQAVAIALAESGQSRKRRSRRKTVRARRGVAARRGKTPSRKGGRR
jgi:hypothetical protein